MIPSFHTFRLANYQSAYFVPSNAIPVDFEYTSNTFFPPQLVESGSSCTERKPHSARPVIGSFGTRRRNRIFFPAAPEPPTATPFTSVSRSGGYPSLPSSTRIFCWSAKSLYLSIALRISRKSSRNSFSRSRITVNFAIGNAMEEIISRMVHATISSSSDIPACAEFLALRCMGMASTSVSYGNLLYAERCLAGHQRDGSLLRIFRIHLNNRKIGRARCQRLHHHAQQRAGSVHAGRIRLPRRRDNRLPVFFVHALHERNLLRSAGEESSEPHFLNADDRGIVLQQHGNAEEVVHIFHHHADGRRLPRSQVQRRRLKANPRPAGLRLRHCRCIRRRRLIRGSRCAGRSRILRGRGRCCGMRIRRRRLDVHLALYARIRFRPGINRAEIRLR